MTNDRDFIGSHLSQVKREVLLEDEKTYKLLGVKWYGQGVFLREEKRGSEIKAKKLYRVKTGDFVYNRLFAWKSSFAIIEEEHNNCLVSNEFPVFTHNPSKTNLDFLLQFVLQPSFIGYVNRQSGGMSSVSRKRFKEDSFLKAQFPKTKLAEQASIAQYCRTIEGEVCTLQNEIKLQQTLLKKLRQSILQEAIEGKLTADWRKQNPDVEPASKLLERIKAEKEQLIKEKKIKKQKPLPPIENDEKPFELPEGWVWCRLGDIAEAQDPNPSHRMPSKDLHGVPFISPVNVDAAGNIDFEKGKRVSGSVLRQQQSLYTVESHSFAFSRIGTIGVTFKLPLPQNYCLSYSLSVITPILPILEEFIMKAISSQVVLKQAIHGTTKNTIPDLGMNTIRKFVLPLPPLSEQTFIIKKAEALLACQKLLEVKNSESEDFANRMMQVVISEAFERPQSDA